MIKPIEQRIPPSKSRMAAAATLFCARGSPENIILAHTAMTDGVRNYTQHSDSVRIFKAPSNGQQASAPQKPSPVRGKVIWRGKRSTSPCGLTQLPDVPPSPAIGRARDCLWTGAAPEGEWAKTALGSSEERSAGSRKVADSSDKIMRKITAYPSSSAVRDGCAKGNRAGGVSS